MQQPNTHHEQRWHERPAKKRNKTPNATTRKAMAQDIRTCRKVDISSPEAFKKSLGL